MSQTPKKYREQGATALQEGKRTGDPTRLSVEQLSQLATELHKGAEHYGFSGAVWTRPRINEVVKRLIGVSYDPSETGRILKKVGLARADRSYSEKPNSKTFSPLPNGKKNDCLNSIGAPKRKNQN